MTEPPEPSPVVSDALALDEESSAKAAELHGEEEGQERLAVDVCTVLAQVPSASDITWVVSLPSSSQLGPRVAESLFTLADGVIGTRGSLEEDGAGSDPATVAAGIYEANPGTGQSLLVAPPWNGLALEDEVPPGIRILDLRTGVLWRLVPKPGEREEGTVLRTARWASLSRPGVEVLVADAELNLLDATAQGAGVTLVEHRSSLGAEILGLLETRVASAGADMDRRTVLERLAVYGAGPHRPHREVQLSLRRTAARRLGVPRLLAEQQAAWAARWATSDVEVCGDPELTQALRLAMFHIAASVADHGEAALGARGLSGTAYAGHVFWDADVFVLPVLAATHPAAARAMLEYRIRRLPEARRAARVAGRAGARFPWESAADGRDVTPTSGVNELGDTVPIRTGALEEHVTADIAWAAWHLASLTGSWRFLEGPGRGLLVDTARYWASRILLDCDGRGHIEGVIGPDEYHEEVDDNAYTNVMAAWNLCRGAEVLERTGGAHATAEASTWRQLADALVTGYEPRSGRHRQFTGYDDLEPLMAVDVGRVPVAADVVLGRDRLGGSQIIKQADVVMLHHLVPEVMPPGSLARDLEHYLPRTAHGSTLSPAVHAAVLARAGWTDQALAFLDVARRIDLEDLTGTTAGGLHMAAMGGLWQAVVMGFAGVRATRPDAPALVVDPRVPQEWGELRFRMCWHGRRLELRCRPDAVHVACRHPLDVVVGDGERLSLSPPGRWIELDPDVRRKEEEGAA